MTKRFYCSFYREVRSVLNKPLMSLEWTMRPQYQSKMIIFLRCTFLVAIVPGQGSRPCTRHLDGDTERVGL